MAEEGTLGLARAQEDFAEEPSKFAEEPSKEELQRRMDKARDSISHTVTEIKETVANQVQAVKDTLDWREQFRKRPVAWSVGSAGAGFALGYCLAAYVRGDGREEELDFYVPQGRSYAAQPIIGGGPAAAAAERTTTTTTPDGNGHDEGPSFLQKLSHTPAFGRVKDEAVNVGDAFIQELGKAAKQLLLPAVMNSIKNFIGGHLPASSRTDSSRTASMGNDTSRTKQEDVSSSSYQPTLERGNN